MLVTAIFRFTDFAVGPLKKRFDFERLARIQSD